MTLIRIVLCCAALVVFGSMAHAGTVGFTGQFDHSNFVFNQNGGDGQVEAATLTDLTLIGDNSGQEEHYTTYLVDIVTPGTLTFNWVYSSIDDAGWDGLGYWLNGSFYELSLGSIPGGTTNVVLSAGGSFGFVMWTGDGVFGPGQATISGLDFTAAPEPSTVVLLGSALLSLRIALRKKRPA